MCVRESQLFRYSVGKYLGHAHITAILLYRIYIRWSFLYVCNWDTRESNWTEKEKGNFCRIFFFLLRKKNKKKELRLIERIAFWMRWPIRWVLLVFSTSSMWWVTTNRFKHDNLITNRKTFSISPAFSIRDITSLTIWHGWWKCCRDSNEKWNWIEQKMWPWMITLRCW
jgi:hypothetical protein